MSRAEFDAMAHAAFLAVGDFMDAFEANYTPPGGGAAVSCRVLVERDSQVIGEFGQVVASRTQVQILKADVAAPSKGATVAIAGGEAFVLDAPASAPNDPTISAWWVTDV